MKSEETDDHRPEPDLAGDSLGFDEAATVHAERAAADDGAGTFRRIGDYELIRELGRGGQGYVHLARDRRLNRLVAIKLLPSSLLSSDRARQRFYREAEAASRLDDPGICTVYETGEVDGIPFIAMQYVEGAPLSLKLTEARAVAAQDGDLRNLLFEETTQVSGQTSEQDIVGPRGLGPVLRFLESVARSLHVAHEAGMIHRDIKPGNIMIGRDGKPVILDFGLAKIEEEDGDPGLTKTGDIVGTPAYMAPEQLSRTERGSDRRFDVYALGVTLYECLTLTRPFHGPTREALYRNILTREATPPSRLNGRIDRDLEIVALTAMEKDPDRRYQTALDLAEELWRIRHYKPIEARPAGPVLRMRRWIQRNPRVALLWGAIVVLLSGGLSISAWQNSKLDVANAELADSNLALAGTNMQLGDANLQLEHTNLELDAKRAEAEANHRTALATAERLGEALTKMKRLSDHHVLRRLARLSNELWPATPDRVAEYETWLDDAERLLDRVPRHVSELAALREIALPYTEEDRHRDHAATYERIARLEAAVASMNRDAEAMEADEELEALERRLDAAEDEIARLEEETERRASWSFESENDAWVHDLLEDLVRRLDRFTNEDTGSMASIERRLVFARTIRKRSIDDHLSAWEAAIAAVSADGRFAGVVLSPQLGLVPLGADPDSGLQEFLYLESHDGPIPTRNAKGRLETSDDMGLVFVLVPGGRFAMGAQNDDEDGANFCRAAAASEGPVHEVELAPYFISKYEMTQAQWKRLTGTMPSYYGPNARIGGKQHSLRHPVEQMSWNQASQCLDRAGLVLPTEAQWERAARAGTSTPWWTGATPESLAGAANIADAYCKDNGGPADWEYETWLDDGYSVHAPVDAHAANPFGLHGIHGNVREWCRDGYGSYAEPWRAGDGLRLGDPSNLRVARGGSYRANAGRARVTSRLPAPRTTPGLMDGLRPARALD